LIDDALSAVGEDILAALGRYKVMTVSQMLDATGRDEKTLRKRLRSLVAGDFVGCREFRLGQTSGRLPNAYWLASKGVRWVRQAMDIPAKVSRRENMSITQVPHRILTVDALISADRWARETGLTRPTFRTYLEGTSSRVELGSKTAIADALIELNDTRQNRRTYVLEVYCDYLDNSTSKPFEKLEPYVTAGFGNALDESLGIGVNDKAALILVICDHGKMRDRVLRGLPGRAGMPPADKRVWQKLLFKAGDELHDFGSGWHRTDGSRVNLPI
jgi:hypothetical protein